MKYRVRQNGGARTAGPPPSPHQRALARGLELHQAGRLPEAEAIYRQVLAADPGNAHGAPPARGAGESVRAARSRH